MSAPKKIRKALISVFHKDGLEPIVRALHDHGVGILSTGGTRKFVEDLGIPVEAVEELTDYPSILGGRVKTLHPKVFGGILSRREESGDVAQLEEFEIPEIDLVIVDLYPFEQTVASGASEQDIIEKIDIGGISLIRAAAKNFKDVVIVPSMNEYSYLGEILKSTSETTIDQRKHLATCAFNVTRNYDRAIHQYFDGYETSGFIHTEGESKELRYGENPHQKGWFHGKLDDMFDQLHGKELSYNNLLDVDAAVNLMAEFTDTTFAILKHNNACGLASRETLVEAYRAALAGDPVSAFGGILICNKEMDVPTAEEVNKLFCEVVIAPSFEDDALELLKGKKNRILLERQNTPLPTSSVRTALNGFLVQNKDMAMEVPSDLTCVTKASSDEGSISDMLFAMKIAKHTKSNTIVFAKNNQLLASGTGQTSRVDALKQAVEKANNLGLRLEGAVMASDAFFPFPDCVTLASEAGIKHVIQPGGSINDSKSIDACNELGLAMYTTGVRHFRH